MAMKHFGCCVCVFAEDFWFDFQISIDKSWKNKNNNTHIHIDNSDDLIVDIFVFPPKQK